MMDTNTLEDLKLEVCVDSVESSMNAQAGGANRVELCDNLFEGGTTPSAGMIKIVRDQINIGLMVMIRPRGGDFLYSAHEIELMKYDIAQAKKLGADGVVFGCLTPEGEIDKVITHQLMECAGDMDITFHRAFDMVADPFSALDDLIELGISRVLTSGLERSALEGADLIEDLVRHAEGKITILAGGGVRPYNIQKLVGKTKVKECHVSGRKPEESAMKFRNGRVSMGGALQLPEFSNSVVDAKVIKSFRS